MYQHITCNKAKGVVSGWKMIEMAFLGVSHDTQDMLVTVMTYSYICILYALPATNHSLSHVHMICWHILALYL